MGVGQGAAALSGCSALREPEKPEKAGKAGWECVMRRVSP